LGEGRVALYQMRGVQEAAQITPASTSIDYMQVLIPGGRSEAHWPRRRALPRSPIPATTSSA
jgi:hypothetical protein